MLTRRDFLATSGGALALTAVALAWAPARSGAAALPASGASGTAGTPDASTSHGIERRRRFLDGSLRTVAWSRGGGARRVSLRDAQRVELVTPRGHALLRIADPRARDAIARELSSGVLREVMAEAARLA